MKFFTTALIQAALGSFEGKIDISSEEFNENSPRCVTLHAGQREPWVTDRKSHAAKTERTRKVAKRPRSLTERPKSKRARHRLIDEQQTHENRSSPLPQEPLHR